MNDILTELASVDLSKGGFDNKRLVEMINQLSTNENWIYCSNFLITNFERVTSQEEIDSFVGNAAFYACCGSIESALKPAPSEKTVSTYEVEKMSNFLRKWVKLYISKLNGQINCSILKKKIAQLVCLAVMRYYPQNWASIFDEILSLFTDCGDENFALFNLLDVFLELLNELDLNAFDRSLNQTPDQSKRTNEVKDAMRVSCLPAIINTLTGILQKLQADKPRELDLISTTLQLIGRYTLWIDLNLVYNEKYMMILRNFIQLAVPSVLTGVCCSLERLITKGMPPFPDKITLIVSLWPDLFQKIIDVPCINHFLRVTSSNQMTNGVNENWDTEEMENLLLEFAKLVKTIGNNLFICFDTLLSGNPNEVPGTDPSTWHAALQSCIEKMDLCFDISVNLTAHYDMGVCVAAGSFIEDYLDLLKEKKLNRAQRSNRIENRLELTDARRRKFSQLLTVLFEKVKIPTDDPDDDHEEFEVNRKVFVGYIRAIVQVDSLLVMDGICSLLQQTLSQIPQSNCRLEDIGGDVLGRLEAALYLFFTVGELYRAPKEGFFSDSYEHGPKMRAVMSAICASNVSAIPYFAIQLNYFEVIGRFERFFSSSPKYLLNVLQSFLDERGLFNPNVQVRSRCAYLFTRFIKCNKSALVPHMRQILEQLEGLLPINHTPDIPISPALNGFGNSTALNGCSQHLFKVSEQSFIYEACANLIMACATTNDGGGVDESARLFASLLATPLMAIPKMVRLLAEEKIREMAEARGSLIKQTIDLITRTTRVLPATPTPQYVQIVMEILEVLVRNLALLPPVPGTPGRGFVCVGVRAYIHRLVGYIGPECGVLIKPTNEANNGDVGAGHPASDMLLRGIVTATPYLVAIVSPNNPNIILEDQDVRWKELKEHIPLFSQLVARYKNLCLQTLSECLPPLIAGTMSALAEPLDPSNTVAAQERVDLRRSLLQLLQTVGQVLSQDILVALGSDAGNILINLAGLMEDCLKSADAIGMKYGFVFFLACIQRFASSEDAFYEGFLLPHLLPLAFLSPARPEFILTDPQFVAALHESTSCIFAINAARGEVFQQYLQHTFLPQQNLAQNIIQLYIEKLRTLGLKEFQDFVQNFYVSFR